MTEGDESLNEARESEAAIRSAAKALKERESTQRAIVDLSKKLNDALTKEKGLLGDIEKGQGNIKNILKQQETRQKLIRNLEQERQTLLLKHDELSVNQVLNIQVQIDAAKQLGVLADGEVDKLKEKNILIDLSKSQMDTLNTLTGGLAEKAVDFVNALKANPMVLIASAIVGLIKMMLEVGNAAAEIGRNLGVGAKEARAINQSFNSIASNSKDFTQTAAKIGQAMNLINEGLGTSATLFGGALLDTMSTLQNRMGLTADATFGLYQAASLSGKSKEET